MRTKWVWILWVLAVLGCGTHDQAEQPQAPAATAALAEGNSQDGTEAEDVRDYRTFGGQKDFSGSENRIARNEIGANQAAEALNMRLAPDGIEKAPGYTSHHTPTWTGNDAVRTLVGIVPADNIGNSNYLYLFYKGTFSDRVLRYSPGSVSDIGAPDVALNVASYRVPTAYGPVTLVAGSSALLTPDGKFWGRWSASSSRAEGSIGYPTTLNGYSYVATTGGTSGLAEPPPGAGRERIFQ